MVGLIDCIVKRKFVLHLHTIAQHSCFIFLHTFGLLAMDVLLLCLTNQLTTIMQNEFALLNHLLIIAGEFDQNIIFEL